MSQIYVQTGLPEASWTTLGASTATLVATPLPMTLKYSVPFGSVLVLPDPEDVPADLTAIRVTTSTDPTPTGMIDRTADVYVVITIPGTITANATAALANPGRTLGLGLDPLMLVPEGDIAAIDTILTTAPWDVSDKLWCIVKRVLRNKTLDFQQA